MCPERVVYRESVAKIIRALVCVEKTTSNGYAVPSYAETLLEVRNLTRRHPDGRRRLLDDVSLRVGGGERLAVVGPSGSGKTLLLRAMARLDPVDGGEVRFRGAPIRHDRVPRFRRQVIYLHQRPALPGETVAAVLQQPFSLAVHHGESFDPDRIVGLLGVLHRDDSFLAKRTADLSGGEIQLVALLRALQLDPTILLLDEPTAALDPRTTRAVEDLLVAWVEETSDIRAMVWVTHDADQAVRAAQQVLSMDQGKIVGDR